MHRVTTIPEWLSMHLYLPDLQGIEPFPLMEAFAREDGVTKFASNPGSCDEQYTIWYGSMDVPNLIITMKAAT